MINKHKIPFSQNKKNKKISSSFTRNAILSNPEKILYPEIAITKLDIAHYYQKVQDWLLPYIIQRFLTVRRCPQGRHKKCFYQRHLQGTVENIYSYTGHAKNKSETYLYIKDKWGLMALVQLGVLEIHPWGCRIDAVEKPDIITFDLDPAPNVEWKKVIDAAFCIKENLAKLKLICFVKTTGGKGLHIVIPIRRQYTWDEVKIFAQSFVNYMVALNPALYIAQLRKSQRIGKIFIDYLRNQRGASAIAPYSTRAKENAPIATPLAWEELSVRIKSDSFTIKTLPKRLARLQQDPWAEFFILKQTLRLPKI
jgi:bifunctional non-homologous end joining protein LigD